MLSVRTRQVRVVVAALAVATTAALGVPATAHAEPDSTQQPGSTTSPDATTTPGTTSPGTTTPETTTPGTTTPGTTTPSTPNTNDPGATTVPEIPGDAELAEIVRQLKESGGAEKAIEALTAILSSDGQLDPSKYLGSSGSLLESIGLDPSALGSLGITPPSETTPTTPGTTTPQTTTPQSDTPGQPPTTQPDTTTPSTTTPSTTTPSTATPTTPSTGQNQVSAPIRGIAPNSAADSVISILQKATGTQMLSPAISPLCVDPTADNPLGLSTAPAVAVPGPWPTVKAGDTDLVSAISKLLPAENKNLLKAIDDNETAYAIVPPATPGADNFRVAWFNTTTMQGGIEDLKPLSQVKGAEPLKELLTKTEQFHGVRLAKVKTGKGNILSAVFGTTTTAGRTCFFLPALGSVEH